MPVPLSHSRSRSSCAIADTVRVQSVREFKARTEAAHVRFSRTVQCSASERARACPCAATLVAYSLPLSRSMRAGRGRGRLSASVPRRPPEPETKGIDSRVKRKCSDLDFSLVAFVSGVVFCSPASSEPLLYLFVCIYAMHAWSSSLQRNAHYGSPASFHLHRSIPYGLIQMKFR